MKKLKLDRETVRELSAADLRTVAGGEVRGGGDQISMVCTAGGPIMISCTDCKGTDCETLAQKTYVKPAEPALYAKG